LEFSLSIASIGGPVQTLAIEIPGTFNCWQGQSGYLGSSAKAGCVGPTAIATAMQQRRLRVEKATPRLPVSPQHLPSQQSDNACRKVRVC
jgi:hypothetical protein